MNTKIQIDPGEKVVAKIRKHWIILLRDAIGTIIVAFLPVVVFPLIAKTVPAENLPQAYGSIASFFIALWLLIVWMSLFVIWTNYYLDVWVITNHRIFNIEQVSLFHRTIATWAMDRIQEITIKIENPIQDFLDYGLIEIQTAGPTAEYAKMEGIPDPNRVRTIVLEQISALHPETTKEESKVDEKVAPNSQVS